MKYDAAILSEVGPRSINEDQVEFWIPTKGVVACAIADGLGGMGGGEQASHLAMAALHEVLDRESIDLDRLILAAEKAHSNIKAAQKASPELKRMATTLTAAVIIDDTLFGVHCGDTRAAIARGNGIQRLTTDHSEGERLFKAGKLTKSDLLEYPRKNILESALGVEGVPQIDTFQIELLPGDKVFLTTDGVHGKILLREMRSIAEHHSAADAFIREISNVIVAREPEDNFSILAIFVGS